MTIDFLLCFYCRDRKIPTYSLGFEVTDPRMESIVKDFLIVFSCLDESLLDSFSCMESDTEFTPDGAELSLEELEIPPTAAVKSDGWSEYRGGIKERGEHRI